MTTGARDLVTDIAVVTKIINDLKDLNDDEILENISNLPEEQMNLLKEVYQVCESRKIRTPKQPAKPKTKRERVGQLRDKLITLVRKCDMLYRMIVYGLSNSMVLSNREIQDILLKIKDKVKTYDQYCPNDTRIHILPDPRYHQIMMQYY